MHQGPSLLRVLPRFRSSSVVFVCALLLLNGCEGCILLDGPITLDQILTAGQLLMQALQFLDRNSADTTGKIKADYSDLGEFLKTNSVDAPHVKEIEARHTEMLNSADALRSSLNDTKDKAERLFDLLDKRANQVSTQEIKTAMMNDDARKRAEFNHKLDTTKTALATLDGYIKKYDDILAALQHQVAMQVLNGYTADVGRIASQVEVLSIQIQQAIHDDMQLIDPAWLRGSANGSEINANNPAPVGASGFSGPNPGSNEPSVMQAPPALPTTPLPQTRQVVLPQGTPVMVRLDTPIPFGAYPEHQFDATLSQELDAGGLQIAKAGSVIHGRVAEEASSGGTTNFQMRLLIDQVSLYDGRTTAVSTQILVTSGDSGQVLAAGAVFPFLLSEPVTVAVRTQ